MTVEELTRILLWCAGINYVFIIFWFCLFVFAHDWIYRMHLRWFKLPVETFDAINYAGVALYKVGNMLFFVVPLIALLLRSPP
jgi:hypothetical protein